MDEVSEKGSATVHGEKETGALAIYTRIFSYSESADWLLNAVGLVAAIGSGVALAMIELLFGNFVNIIQDFTASRSTPQEFRHDISSATLNFVYVFVGRFVCSYVFTVCLTITGTRITRNIRQHFLEATLSQDIAYFDENKGSVSVRVTTNGNLIQQGISEKLGLVIQATATCVAAIIVALITQWKLTLITMTIAPVIVIVVGIAIGIDAKIESGILDIYGQAAALAEDVISSVRNVQAFWMRPHLTAKYDGYLAEAHRRGKTKSALWGVLYCTEFFLIYAGFSLCFWRGVHMFAEGEIDGPGTIVTVLFSVVIASTSLTQISPYFTAFANAASAASALFDTIDRPSLVNPLGDNGTKPEQAIGNLEFSHVDFSYPTRPNVRVLKQFSLTFPAKKTTALVGASGSGKSTVVGLLERWYNPNGGTITLDGHRIECLNVNWLRTRMRLVQQEPVLFNDTVFGNVRNGLTGTKWENAPREQQLLQVIEACKLSNAHDFISELPEGYDTHVGERAGLLSGGQKQRIAIARAIVSDPEILLLDEATSALDPHSETIVQHALDRAAANRTTIVIAHKLATVKNAHNIVVMSKGEVIEQGNHQHLLAKDGAYARLVQAQGLEAKTQPGLLENSSGSESENDLVETVSSNEVAHVAEQQSGLDYSHFKEHGMFWVVGKILGEQRTLWPLFGFIFITCCVGGAVYPAQAVVLAELMDVFTYTGKELTKQGDFFSLIFFIIALANLIVYFILGWCSNVVSQALTHFYRREMLDALLRQDIQFFDRAENTTGALTSRLSSQPTQLQELMGFNLSIIIIVFINVIASSILGLSFGWKLGLVVIFGGLPPLVGAGLVRMRLEAKMNNDTGKRFADSAALAGEAVGAIRTVSSLALERRVLENYRLSVDGIVRVSIPSIIHSMFWFALSQSIEFLVLALGFWYGSRLVSTREYSMHQFFIVFVGVFLSGQAAAQFFMYTTSITKAISAGNYIWWLRSLKPVVTETDENKDIGPDADAPLVLNDVRFSYPTRHDTKVLRGISISIQPGNFIALVGGSGCGKSTMISMFERFYDPTSGAVQLGKNIASMNPRLYRRQMALVQQEPTLYQGTIRENISLGLEDAKDSSEERILEACRQSNIYDFIASLPEGLDTLCGSRGASLSGGQRQRIAIARALIRNPKVLLLDEATSALDTESERVVQTALSDAASQEKRITVAVAHRLSTIKDASCIFVFFGGRIAESGTHKQLVDKGGMYYEMCKAQSLDQAV
ncbi:uncharacterized protein K452DRAFT_303071 [Aplosporella prunicola CBS 121167]|uniref:ABC transporter n=1 Tax=Aplosporella prunicola CBS 121167 TaxID=1176127 RepID=A0A6A6AVI8_9PEZI|nr:uncharacterized protein K452DRAFT_303071 [Aplosporella prunicola CBS 121167]KAF2136052.1 hypothetical protein K452DRAFT_303071 [Aplosporella prunicola CBS 121167]